MLIVRLEENPNGTRANQQLDFPLKTVPEGYAVVPPELESAARGYLPWLSITIDPENNIVAVEENTTAKEVFLAQQAAEAAAAAEAEETTGEDDPETAE